MPQCLRDSVIVPIPEGNKDASCISSNFRPVALSSNLSKVLERLITLLFLPTVCNKPAGMAHKINGISNTLCYCTTIHVSITQCNVRAVLHERVAPDLGHEGLEAVWGRDHVRIGRTLL